MTAQLAAAGKPAEHFDSRCRGVLIVEDDADIRESLRDLLVGEGYPVLTAVNGQDGLDQLSNIERPCLVLLDMMMPVLDGAGFLARVQETSLASIPIVIVSAVAKVQPGTVGLIRKPIDLNALLNTVSRYCEAAA